MIRRWAFHKPAESWEKVLRACQYFERDTYSKIFANKNYTTQDPKDSFLKSPLFESKNKKLSMTQGSPYGVDSWKKNRGRNSPAIVY
jgi:hypothetical protein